MMQKVLSVYRFTVKLISECFEVGIHRQLHFTVPNVILAGP